MSGAGAVRLGMTEAEVTKALGKNPSRRDDAQSPGASTDVAWDELNGPRPGAALGRFRDDRLYSIEFAPAEQDVSAPRLRHREMPSRGPSMFVDPSRGRCAWRTSRRSRACPATARRGRIMGGFGSATRVKSKWIWEVDSGDRILYVTELDGVAGQPVIRSKRWGKDAIRAGS